MVSLHMPLALDTPTALVVVANAKLLLELLPYVDTLDQDNTADCHPV